jgi:hypothetical protein
MLYAVLKLKGVDEEKNLPLKLCDFGLQFLKENYMYLFYDMKILKV